MFIVSLTYKSPLADVDLHIPAHITYLEKYYALGNFIMSGRKKPRTGGVIIAKASSREELQTILQQDPFFIADVASYDITEFTPTMTARGLDNFKVAV